MPDIESLGEVLPNYSTKMKPSLYVKDADLQIHVPYPDDVPRLEEAHTFKNVLANYFGDVNTLKHDADAQVQRLVAGETDNLHEVTLAMDQAQTAFDLMMEIRSKLVSAYSEVLHMQV